MFARLLAWTCWARSRRSAPETAVKISLSMCLHRLLHQGLHHLVLGRQHLRVGLVVALRGHQAHQFRRDVDVRAFQRAGAQLARQARPGCRTGQSPESDVGGPAGVADGVNAPSLAKVAMASVPTTCDCSLLYFATSEPSGGQLDADEGARSVAVVAVGGGGGFAGELGGAGIVDVKVTGAGNPWDGQGQDEAGVAPVSLALVIEHQGVVGRRRRRRAVEGVVHRDVVRMADLTKYCDTVCCGAGES
jgi:hypothetical protein